MSDDKTVVSTKKSSATVIQAKTKAALKTSSSTVVSRSSEPKASLISRAQSARTVVDIGKYKHAKEIAKGGMGAVYVAEHPSLKRQVIIKKLTLKTGGKMIHERFRREAQIMMDLSSPYVVRLYDHFHEGRSDYIVLELVDGISLDKLIENNGSLPPQLALLIFLDACYGLQAAHRKKIIHRDIKPGNILMSKTGQVKLADFGIAGNEKDDDAEVEDKHSSAKDMTLTGADMNLTMSGTALGTPAYMSPEQLDDASSVDYRADIYSMGVMLYEMVTGNKPYDGDMSRKTISKIKKGDYIPPQKFVKDLPKVVRSLIKKMMKPKKERRYKSIDPVIQKIKKYLGKYDTHAIRVELARSVISGKAYKFSEYVEKNHGAKKLFGALGFAACLGAGFWYAWNEGLVHKYFMTRWYTPVTLRLVMPSTASPEADIPARAFFFVNDGGEIPEVEGTRRVFYADSEVAGDNIECTIKPVYLKPGKYRVKIAEGPCVWWKSLNVEDTAVDMKLDFLKNATRNLAVHFKATDSETGEDLTDKTVFQISSGGKYQNVSDFDMTKLKTGSIYKFIAQTEGFSDEYFSLRLDWYQDELFINASMRKK